LDVFECFEHQGGSCNCAVHEFVQAMMQLVGDWRKWIGSLSSPTNPHIRHNLTEDEEDSYQQNWKCHLCTKCFIPYRADNIKVRDHCHIVHYNKVDVK